MSTKEHPVDLRESTSLETCAVCGVTIESTDIEDTNGWRWFNDGAGGLLPLCPTCPVPEIFLAAAAESR